MFRGAIPFIAGVAVAVCTGWYAFPHALYRHTPQPLQFSHRVHADKAGMKCEDCHSFRADGSFTGIPQIEKCAGCHATPAGNTDDEKLLVDRYVTPNREIPWKVYARQPDNAWFPHAFHVKVANLACERCHGEHGKTGRLREYESDRVSGYTKTGMKMSDCEGCHDRERVTTGCIDCHK
jgi:hypothetical protein